MIAGLWTNFHPVAWMCLFVVFSPLILLAVIQAKKIIKKAKE